MVACKETIEKGVEIPTIHEKIVEVIREVPKLQVVERNVEKIVEVIKEVPTTVI